MDGYAVTLTDSTGEQWALTDGSPGLSGLWLMGPPDLQSEVSARTRATTRQIGGESVGWSVDPMVGTLKLGIWADDGTSLLELWSALMRGLSQFDDSELKVVTPGHGDAVTHFRVDGTLPMPEKSPAIPGLRTLEFDVPVVALDGCWYGDQVVSTEPSTTWLNRGDLPARVMVRWSGSGASVHLRGSGFDTGVVALPTPPAGVVAELDLDPAVASRVSVAGDPHPGMWRSMRARIFPEVLPGHDVEVLLTGVAEVDLSARLTTPWRWSA